MPAYEGQLVNDDDLYTEDDYDEPCDYCGEYACNCDLAMYCKCGAYHKGGPGGFYKVADCYC